MSTTAALKVAIIGSRTYNDYKVFQQEVGNMKKELGFTHIVSGGAKGVDSMAETYALLYDIPITIIKPEWKKYGKTAALLRNSDIINSVDYVIAFHQHSSPGTAHAIALGRKRGIPVKVIKV